MSDTSLKSNQVYDPILYKTPKSFIRLNLNLMRKVTYLDIFLQSLNAFFFSLSVTILSVNSNSLLTHYTSAFTVCKDLKYYVTKRIGERKRKREDKYFCTISGYNLTSDILGQSFFNSRVTKRKIV